jgi:aspartyl-tRNA(Asn)/glutamyl-tRNA(Gln) amidotransferase subunit A
LSLYRLTLHELKGKMDKKEISSEEVTQCFLDRIAALDEKLGAYLTLCDKKALEKAREIDQKRMAGELLGDLAGIPVAIKDNMCTKGLLTTCGSKILGNFSPPYDATVMEKLHGEDIVLLGKLNMDEFAMGGSTESSFFKKTRNPWDLERVPGGSSGGSAACIAAHEAVFSLGSDTGGSIRQPASFCGVVGMKPTYGAVSRYGLIAFASSLDQIGPLTKDVRDMAIVMNKIVGHDRKDSTSAPVEYGNYEEGLDSDIKGMKIAIVKEHYGEGLNSEVKQSLMKAAENFRKLGATVDEVSMTSLDYALPAYYIISSAEASSNLARFDGIKYGFRSENYENLLELYKETRNEGFGKEVKRRILLGTYALSSGYYDAYYKKAQQVRTLVRRDFEKVFENYDFIVGPVAPTTAYKIGEMTNPVESYMGDIYTVPVNIAGLPAIAINCGWDSKGLPIGMQLIGKGFSEKTLLKAAYAYEQEYKEEGGKLHV